MDTDAEETPNPIQDQTVRGCDAALAAHDFAAACACLAAAFQIANPYAEWVATYATTRSIRAEARQFAGTWRLAYSYAAQRWLLQEAQIAPA